MTWLLIGLAWLGLIPALLVVSARRWSRHGLDSRALARREEADGPRAGRESAG
jgi:hypothetical protein